MQKDEKRKKMVEKLRMILDNNSDEKLHPEDEKYLKALRKRLGGSSSGYIAHIKETFKEDDGEEDPLKPRVVIHQKEEQKIVEFPEVKPVEVEELEKEEEEKQDSLPQDESLYEVEKVEVEGPEFIEVKPKETTKEEETAPAEEKDEVEKSEETEEKKLPEWEPVSIEETKTEESKEKTFEEALPQPVEEKEEETSELEPMPVIEEEKEEAFIEDQAETADEFYEEEEEFQLEEETPKSEFAKEDDIFFEEGEEEVEFEKDEETKAFDGINSIDEKTAKLLYENGITSIDILSETPIKKLIKIKGIRRKIAKRIKKEVSEMPKKTEEIADWNAADADLAIDEFKESDESKEEWESFADGEMTEEQEGYRHGEYTLYVKEIETKTGKKRTVHFFSKGEPEEGEPVKLPKGYEVKVNKRTRVPYIKKKK
jgi:hypothetical protein